MTTYFSDRELGPKPTVETAINGVVWQAILSLVETRVNDGSLAYGFPSHCPDGNAIEGTDRHALWNVVRAEIGELAMADAEAWDAFSYVMRSTGNLPSTPAILDLIEFVARHVAQPSQGRWHEFFRHHHLDLDRKEGLRKFVEDVNRVFSRSGLAYQLTATGVAERTVPVPMADQLNRTEFCTGNQELDELLDTAIKRFLLPEPEARQDALEKLWDAFERLKSIEAPGDKKAGASILIDKAIAVDAKVLHSAITEEFKAMTTLGNELRIRHSEVGQEPVGDNGEKDYLFIRLLSLIRLMLKATGRLSEARNVEADAEDEDPPF